MKAKYFSLYILITLLSVSQLYSQTTVQVPLKRSVSALMQSALNSSRAVAQRNPITSIFLFLGGSYIVAETISYKYRKKTFFVETCQKYLHDAAYWAIKKLLCSSRHTKPIILNPQQPELYKS